MARNARFTVTALVGACALSAVTGLIIGGAVGGAAIAQQAGTAQTTAVTQQSDGERARYVARFMELYDTNGDGTVRAEDIAAEQKRLFHAIDVDGDGVLSVDEIRRRGHILEVWRTTTLFDLMDVNGDQKLTLEEITAPMKRWFARYANSDGVMTADDVPVRRRPDQSKSSDR
jgi:hypothetical protein